LAAEINGFMTLTECRGRLTVQIKHEVQTDRKKKPVATGKVTVGQLRA